MRCNVLTCLGEAHRQGLCDMHYGEGWREGAFITNRSGPCGCVEPLGDAHPSGMCLDCHRPRVSSMSDKNAEAARAKGYV